NDFIIMIMKGEREDIIPETPEFYSNLYKGKVDCLYIHVFDDKSIKSLIFFYTECWKENPEERPQMSKVVEILNLKTGTPAPVPDSKMDINLDIYITSSIEKNIFTNSNDNYNNNYNNISLSPQLPQLISRPVIVDYENI